MAIEHGYHPAPHFYINIYIYMGVYVREMLRSKYEPARRHQAKKRDGSQLTIDSFCGSFVYVSSESLSLFHTHTHKHSRDDMVGGVMVKISGMKNHAEL